MMPQVSEAGAAMGIDGVVRGKIVRELALALGFGPLHFCQSSQQSLSQKFPVGIGA